MKPSDDDDAIRACGLTRSIPEQGGYRRRRCGRGFSYIDGNGRVVSDRGLRERLQALAAPPAWQDVWYAPSPSAHIQATGYDQRGRRQYIYHPAWRTWRDTRKFHRMAAFGAALPRLRRKMRAALDSDDLLELACGAVATLLDKAALRVGSAEYAKENGTFGAASLLKRHLTIERDRIVLDFCAKGSKRRHIELADPALSEALAELDDQPGRELFRIVDGDGEHQLTSCDVNAWIRGIAGEEFSAKDFRTFKAAALFLEALAGAGQAPDGVRRRASILNAAYERVARQLGNTASVCKSSYCPPAFAEAWQEGRIPAFDLAARKDRRRLPLRDKRAIHAFRALY